MADKGLSATIAKEMTLINKNEIWKLVNLPTGKQTINSKWIFKAKKGSLGVLDKLKACLVARGAK